MIQSGNEVGDITTLWKMFTAKDAIQKIAVFDSGAPRDVRIYELAVRVNVLTDRYLSQGCNHIFTGDSKSSGICVIMFIYLIFSLFGSFCYDGSRLWSTVRFNQW